MALLHTPPKFGAGAERRQLSVANPLSACAKNAPSLGGGGEGVDENPLAGNSLADPLTRRASHSAPPALRAPRMHVESFRGSVKLGDAALSALRDELTATADNQARLELLARRKEGVTFTCAQLETLCRVTPSVRTRLSMVDLVGPRTSDPTKAADVIALFRYADEKQRAEGVLANRARQLSRELSLGGSARVRRATMHGDAARSGEEGRPVSACGRAPAGGRAGGRRMSMLAGRGRGRHRG